MGCRLKEIDHFSMLEYSEEDTNKIIIGAFAMALARARLAGSDRTSHVTILHINGRRSIIRLTQWL